MNHLRLPLHRPRHLLRDDKPDASEWGDALRPLLLCVYGILEWQVRETGGGKRNDGDAGRIEQEGGASERYEKEERARGQMRKAEEGGMEEREKERESEDREWGVTTKEERHKDDMRGGRERERGKESGEGKW